jgi:hypothetical protein
VPCRLRRIFPVAVGCSNPSFVCAVSISAMLFLRSVCQCIFFLLICVDFIEQGVEARAASLQKETQRMLEI